MAAFAHVYHLGGSQDPSVFLTMSRGEAHGLVERLTTPAASKAKNSFFAAASFSVSSRRNADAIGGPEVLRKWATSHEVCGSFFPGLSTS